MARLIEIDDGVSLNVSDIEGIKKLGAGGCEIYTHHRKYSSKFPYDTILAMLKEGEVVTGETSPDKKIQNTMSKLDAVLNKSTHFAG